MIPSFQRTISTKQNCTMTRKFPQNNNITEKKYQEESPHPVKEKAYDKVTGHKLYGYHDHQIPPRMRASYIVSGYRFPGMTACQCFGSILQPHNELINIWSHAIPLALFLVQVFPIIRAVNVIEKPHIVPLLCCVLGMVIMFIASIYTHLFNSMSLYKYLQCYFFDYFGISSGFFLISQAIYFYSRPLNTEFRFFNSPEIFLFLNLLNSLLCNYTVSTAVVKRPWYRLFVRSSAFVSLYLFSLSPLICRLVLCHFAPTGNCQTGSLSNFKQSGIYTLIGGIIYATRIPERFAPKIFDVVGQSHNIFHILSGLTVSHLFTALHTDMVERKEALLDSHVSCTELSIMFTVLVIVGNLTMVAWFSKSLLYSRQIEKGN